MTLCGLLHILMLVIIYSTLLTKLDQKHKLVKKLRSIRLRKKATDVSNWGHFHFGFKIRLRKVERTTGQLSQLFLSDSGAQMLAYVFCPTVVSRTHLNLPHRNSALNFLYIVTQESGPTCHFLFPRFSPPFRLSFLSQSFSLSPLHNIPNSNPSGSLRRITTRLLLRHCYRQWWTLQVLT